jgi:hypothetical protein
MKFDVKRERKEGTTQDRDSKNVFQAALGFRENFPRNMRINFFKEGLQYENQLKKQFSCKITHSKFIA